MNHIRLASPTLRFPRVPLDRFVLPTVGVEYLPIPENADLRGFLDVLHARESRREFVRAPEDRDVSDLLWHAFKTKQRRRNDDGYRWEHRPAPSAGGLHPISVLVMNRPPQRDAVFLYDPIAHALGRIEPVNRDVVLSFFSAVNSVLPVGEAAIVWFVADFRLTLSKYENGESLVWRDAGALGATVELVAEALELSSCAIGITGEPFVAQITGNVPMLEGVGGCLIGKRPIARESLPPISASRTSARRQSRGPVQTGDRRLR